MGAWDVLAEAIDSDPDDELAGFTGQLAPRPTAPPWDGRPRRGTEAIHAAVVLPDGRAGVAWLRRPGDLYDVTVRRADGGTEDLVLHSSEFRFG